MKNKPQVIIDLEEYNQLLKIKENPDTNNPAVKILNELLILASEKGDEHINLDMVLKLFLYTPNLKIVWEEGDIRFKLIKSITNANC